MLKLLRFNVFAILFILILSTNIYADDITLRKTGLDLSKVDNFKPTLPAIKATRDLPKVWDWREQGGVTPVKDQGNTGTCWAFATTGPFEHAIKIQDKKNVSLSEQFLISYNNKGYGLDGGWFAHEYHVNPGAVLDIDFPYEASVIPWTNDDYEHIYKLADWGYVDENKNIPTIEAIKTAIYKYGSVAAAVNADYSFQVHRKGVFKGSWWSGRVNHAIMLVGWNDFLGAWILKNSWGTNWGDNGYIYIKYNANNVGYAANYVVYK